MPDFSKIWASASPLPAYTFTDAEYTEGWDFVGSAPPTKNQFDAWFRMVDEKLSYLYGQLQNTASKLYPIGSVYISFNSTDPSTLFGGTWVRIKDKFLLVNGDSYAPNTTGGSSTKSISVTNLPSHNHTVNASTHSHSVTTAGGGNHTHTASSNTTGSHKHARGTMEITGKFPLPSEARFSANDYFDGAFSKGAVVSGSWSSDQNKMDALEINFDASRTWTGETSSAGNHSHTITVNSVGKHTHSVTINNSGSHTHTTNNTGGSVPLNVMPPYITVYAWRRTA